MSQSKVMSLVESLTNVAVGILVSFASQLVIFNAYGIHIALADNVMMTLYFTAISVVRSYGIRRFFTTRRRTK